MTRSIRLSGIVLFLLRLATGQAVAEEEVTRLSVVEVAPYLVSPTSQAVRGEVLFRSLEREEVRRAPLGDVTTLRVELPAGSIWEVSGEVPGFWVRRKTLSVEAPGQVTRLALGLWPLGTISGVLKTKDQRLPRPEQLRVQTLEVPSFLHRAPVPPGALDCPVDRQGRWSCSLPTATFDLVVSAEGWTPVYRWAVEVPAGKSLSLGVIELERGASVAGWVAVDNGVIQADNCVVRLAPFVAAGTDLRKASDLERTAIERPVRRDGFFQLTSLAPGIYSLEVRQPGYAPARLSPVRVEPGAETFLREPLVLERPLDLVFEIEPPLDWLGRPWNARVIRKTDARIDPVVFEGAADKNGRFKVPGQTSGQYRLAVLDSLGNSLYYRNDFQWDESLAGPERIKLDFTDIEGRVRFGGEPLPSTLWFGGKNSAVSMKVETDAEGHFFGVLPKAGFWVVEVEATEPDLRSVRRIEVRANPSGRAKIEIALPETRLFGRVFDEEGKPVRQANVFAESEAAPSQHVQTDSSGSFELRGLAEGLVRVGAKVRSRTSDLISANVPEDGAVGPIDLRLRRSEQFDGAVLSSLGPVAGAHVAVFSLPYTAGGSAGTSGTDGGFTVELPAGVSEVLAVVSAPGFPLKVFGPLRPTDLRLRLTEEEGTLELSLSMSADDVMRKELSVVVFADGHLVPFGLLSQWASMSGQTWVEGDRTTLRVPHLAPGRYDLCLVPRLLEMSLAGSPSEAGTYCASGLLAPAATLSLQPGLSP